MKSRKNTDAAALQPEAAEEINGTVEKLIYRSEETGYTVCTVKMAERDEPVTVVGRCPAIWLGENIKAEGRWTRHKRHGFQFQAEELLCIAPTSAKGIERYLASGMIKGIGKVNACRLVNEFGEDTLRVIDKESQRLEKIDGIGPARRRMIKESWNEQKAVRDIMIFLQSHGVGTAQSARIYRTYGQNAVSIISENPYRLCADIWGIGFKTADKVAMSIGLPHDSPARARAGIVYVMSTLTEEGHCYSPLPELLLKAEELLGIPIETLNTAAGYEIKKGSLIKDDDRIYPASLHAAETGIAARVAKLKNTNCPVKPVDVEKALKWAEKIMGISFDPTQRDALSMALNEKISIITGGPGVGKTTIIKGLVEIFRARHQRVMLAAPTGRAAKRMEEATGQEARTIHRLLKFIPRLGHFTHGPDNPLDCDVVILDEVSMVDISLMHSFLQALRDECILVLVGDIDQLPSVGPGNVLGDFISSRVVPFTKLETIFRQESGGWIVRNAHRVNNGEPLLMSAGEENSDFYFIETNDPDSVVQRTIEIVTQRIPEKFGFDPLNEIQVLTPMRKNQLGAENLNHVLQQALNPSGPSIRRFGRDYRLGDRVMQIRNNYDKEVFNGDIGRIVEVKTEDQELLMDIDGRRVQYDYTELDELIHAYACSIHKSQGSEYPAAVVLMTTQHYRMLQRNLLYTALTRARNLACLIGSKKAVYIAIRNNKIRLRRTALKERLETTLT
ncbi:MAG: ATP-dependent RecD-like DNA helicase [Verrucomicrobiota bacterium]